MLHQGFLVESVSLKNQEFRVHNEVMSVVPFVQLFDQVCTHDEPELVVGELRVVILEQISCWD
jgi:hypothetical protein